MSRIKHRPSLNDAKGCARTAGVWVVEIDVWMKMWLVGTADLDVGKLLFDVKI